MMEAGPASLKACRFFVKNLLDKACSFHRNALKYMVLLNVFFIADEAAL